MNSFLLIYSDSTASQRWLILAFTLTVMLIHLYFLVVMGDIKALGKPYLSNLVHCSYLLLKLDS